MASRHNAGGAGEILKWGLLGVAAYWVYTTFFSSSTTTTAATTKTAPATTTSTAASSFNSLMPSTSASSQLRPMIRT